MKKIMICFMLFLLAFTVQAKKIKELVLTSDNILVLNQSFSHDSVGKLMQEATILDSKLKSGYPIILFLYTPGGSVEAGLELFEFLQGLNRPVHTLTLFAASMGFQAVQQLNKRYILKFGRLMSHKARGGFQGEFGDGFSQLDSRYSLWLRIIQKLDEHTVKRTNGKQTLKSYRNAYSNELWLNGWEAVQQGYADEVVVAKCGVSLSNKTYTKVFTFFGFKILVEFAKCPLNQNPLGIKTLVSTDKGDVELNKFVNMGGKFNCSGKSTELCSSYKNLTLDMIIQKQEEIKIKLSKDIMTSIKYSY